MLLYGYPYDFIGVSRTPNYGYAQIDSVLGLLYLNASYAGKKGALCDESASLMTRMGTDVH